MPMHPVLGEIPGAGFLAGTLVQTHTGLKPVEALTTGAMVLTRPENGDGPDTFKRVTRTFQLHSKEVRAIEYVRSGSVTSTYLYATGEQPFWVVEKGWTHIDELLPGNDLLMADGSTAFVYRKHFVFQSTTEAIGHVIHDVESPGFLLNLSDGRPINDGQEIFISEALNGRQLNSAACHVYNFVMEDGGSCFVGPDGVWVHNKCTALATKPKSSGEAGSQS